MKCPSCGADNAAGLRFCKRCWRSFEEERREAPRPAAPPAKRETPPSRRPLFGVPYAEDDDADTGERGVDWVAPPLGALAPVAGQVHSDARDGAEKPYGEAEAGPSPRAVLSFVLGLLSIVLFCLSFITVPIDLSALVLGLSELKAINGGVRPRAGRGFAVAGVVLSAFALVVKVFLFFT